MVHPTAIAPGAEMSKTQPLALPIDYYELLGVAPVHLFPANGAASDQRPASEPDWLFGRTAGPLRHGFGLADTSRIRRIGESRPAPDDLLTPHTVDQAAVNRELELAQNAALSPEDRAARRLDLEIGRRILRDPERRRRYDSLLLMWRRGEQNQERLHVLRQLQEEVRHEIARERGETPDPEQGAALLREGEAALNAGRQREAVAILRRAAEAAPQLAKAHVAYARALLAADHTLALSSHTLRTAIEALEQAANLNPSVSEVPALTALARGLLARDQSDPAVAERELRQAVMLNPQLAPAWNGLAALALQHGDSKGALVACRQALGVNPRDERAWYMAAAAALQRGRSAEAREAARHVAELRGRPWTAAQVLDEIDPVH